MKNVLIWFAALLILSCPAAKLEIMQESFIDMIYAHRNGKDRVLEMGDSSSVLSASARSAGFALLGSDRDGDREVQIQMELVFPDGSRHGFGEQPVLKLRRDRMLVRNLRLVLDDADVERVMNCSSRYNLTTLRVEAAFSDADGKVLAALNTTAAIGFDRGVRTGFPRAEILPRNGVPTLAVNGEFHPGIFGYVGWNWLPARKSVRDFGEAGFHLYEVVFQPWSIWKGGELSVDEMEKKLNSQIAPLAAQDPDALIFLRYWLYVPRDWAKYHPGEVIRYDDGSSEIPFLGGPWAHASYASPAWRESYKRTVAELIRRLEKGPYADRIFMVRLGYGNCGEWNNFGYHQNKFPGFSPQMRAAYQKFLKKRHSTIADLNANWQSDYGSFEEIEVPGRNERLKGEGAIFRPEQSGNYSDYYRFLSDYTAELCVDFGRTVKEASGGKLLYGVFYGYFLHHLTGAPYHSLDSGHYALRKLLEAKEIDTVCSPYNYHRRDRAISIGMALESIKAHGKLFLAEMDLPTHLADAANYHGTAGQSFGYHQAEVKTMTLYRRDFGRVLTWGVGGYWYDFAHNWYDFAAFRKFLANSARINREAQNCDMRSVAECAVILDEESVYRLTLHSGDWAKALRETLGYVLESVGVPIDFYLASDLDRAAAKGYKLLVFANHFREDKRMNEVLESFSGCRLFLEPAAKHACVPAKCIHAPAGIKPAEAREIFRRANVHRYSETDTVQSYANASVVGVWLPEGARETVKITLPRIVENITDAETGEVVAENSAVAEWKAAAGPHFRLFRIR